MPPCPILFARIAAALLLLGAVPPEWAADAASVKVLALGDSYTIGESEAAASRWPVQLVASLRADGIAAAEPEIIARTGWTTADLLGAIASRKLSGPFDLVTLQIGVND